MTLFCTDGAIFVSSLRLSYLFEHCIVNLFDLKGSQRRKKNGKLPKKTFSGSGQEDFFLLPKISLIQKMMDASITDLIRFHFK